jgi:uncharacterized membrane protein YecN with MAPEG domain
LAISTTLLYGGLCALLVTALGTWVSLLRIKANSYIDKEPPPSLNRPIRAHGNAAEWVPLGVLLLLLLELSGVPATWMHVLGGSFLAGRLMHALGALANLKISTVGATVNYIVLAVMSGWCVFLHFH